MNKTLNNIVDSLIIDNLENRKTIEEINLKLLIIDKAKENSDTLYTNLKKENDEIILNKIDIINELENRIEKLTLEYTTSEKELIQKISNVTLKFNQTHTDFNN